MTKPDEFMRRFEACGEGVQVFAQALILRPEVIRLGDGVRVDDFSRLEGGRGLVVGRQVHISSFASILGGGRCVIGDLAGVSQGARIVTGSEQLDAVMSAVGPAEWRHVETSTVVIDHLAFLGTNAVMLPGTSLGLGAVVGAGLGVVNRAVPAWEVWAGVPARPIGRRDPDALRARGVPVDALAARSLVVGDPGMSAAADRCRLCGGPCRERFRADVLGGRHTARYVECARCRCLQVPDPHWLAEAYANEEETAAHGDTGRLRRNFTAFLALRALASAGAIGDEGPVVDVGGGFGLLTQMLLDAGADAWTCDPHVAVPPFAPHRHVAALEALAPESVGLVVALEVVEHLVDPRSFAAALRRVMAPDAALVLSTGIYRPGRHGADWPYLATEWGQHVTFWSEQGLAWLAGALRRASVAHFVGADGFLVVMSPQAPEALSGGLDAAGRLLSDTAFLAACTECWDLRRSGDVAGDLTVRAAPAWPLSLAG